MHILKFGGTSVADPQALTRSVAIIAAQPAAGVVVVSAAAGVTNALLAMASATTSATLAANKALIIERQQAFIDQSPQAQELAEELAPLFAELDAALPCHDQARDQLLSLGERFSARITAHYLRCSGSSSRSGLQKTQHLPASQLIATDHSYGHAEPDPERTKQQVTALLAQHPDQLIVTEGFVGGDAEGAITTLGRGGSDYSAALIAEAANADLVEIWTDVKGLYTTDPRIVAEARPLAELSFAQAAELATFGAKVLHPKTLWPAMRANIPVFIGSTLDTSSGTTIRREVESQTAYTALALRKNQTLLKITSPDMLYSYGFLAKTFAILAEHRISVDLVTTSEISVALTLDERGSEQALSEQALRALQALGKVQVVRDLALVAIVGAQLNAEPKVAANVFNALADINVQLICHGASPHNICVLVADADGPMAIQRLHQSLF